MEWNFIEEVLRSMNFLATMIEFIMRCISSMTYSVLINGKQGLPFTPQRGLRQGDPLSLYIFILCAEVFSCLLEKAEELKLTDGIRIARTTPSISHIFFTDNSIIFSKANIKAADTISQIIQAYERAYRQQVNLNKTELTFSKNVPEGVKIQSGKG